jgi:hypothetical protein
MRWLLTVNAKTESDLDLERGSDRVPAVSSRFPSLTDTPFLIVGGGARLSVSSLSPPRVRFSTVTEEFSRISIGGSSEGSDETERNT